MRKRRTITQNDSVAKAGKGCSAVVGTTNERLHSRSLTHSHSQSVTHSQSLTVTLRTDDVSVTTMMSTSTSFVQPTNPNPPRTYLLPSLLTYSRTDGRTQGQDRRRRWRSFVRSFVRWGVWTDRPRRVHDNDEDHDEDHGHGHCGGMTGYLIDVSGNMYVVAWGDEDEVTNLRFDPGTKFYQWQGERRSGWPSTMTRRCTWDGRVAAKWRGEQHWYETVPQNGNQAADSMPCEGHRLGTYGREESRTRSSRPGLKALQSTGKQKKYMQNKRALGETALV